MSLPKNCVKISNSANGKCRVIERKRILVAEDLKIINLITARRFFEPDVNDVDGLGEELTGLVDFQNYERILKATNEILCNPNNGVVVSLSGVTDLSGNTTTMYVDSLNNVVPNPIGMFDFFAPFLSQNVSINSIADQQILNEDQIYHTWDK